ncbi:MAG: flagellar hook-length control protein FliK [Symbiobacterium sp.]|uniref:flagellar hook-length control protein FliK n=1 Tax=Symbiobacterium sp. TaxID=1971213 RepID=UPI0034648901
MTAPVVIPGGAPLERAGAGRGSGRKDEATQADGVFAALLAALAPPTTGPGTGAAPAAEPAVGAAEPLAGGFPWLMPLVAAVPGGATPAGQGPAEGVPLDGSFPEQQPGAAGSPVTTDFAAFALPDGPALTELVVAGPEGSPAPTGDPGEAGADGAGRLPQDMPAVRLESAPAPSPVAEPEQADGEPSLAPEPAATAEEPVTPSIEAPGTAPVRSAEPEAPAEQDAGQSPEADAAGRTAAVTDDGGVQPEPVTGPAPEATPVQAPEVPDTAEAPRGLDRLTARSLQVQQVVEELTRAVPELPDGQYRLTLRLHPEHLGEVRLQLHLSGREVHAAMEVATADARQDLESRGDQLRQSLAEAGYVLADFEVATGQGRQPRQDLWEGPAGWTQPPARRAASPEVAPAPAIGRVRPSGPRGGRLDTKA